MKTEKNPNLQPLHTYPMKGGPGARHVKLKHTVRRRRPTDRPRASCALGVAMPSFRPNLASTTGNSPRLARRGYRRNSVCV